MNSSSKQLIGNRVNNWGDLIWEFLVLIQTSVACAIGTSVNTFFYFSLKISNFDDVNTHTFRAQLIFPSKPKFCNLFEFPATKSTQKSIPSIH